jgi:gluconate 2-dehydrogenase gamma chain
MTRRERPDRNRNFASFIDEWRQQLMSRRRFLLRSLATTTAASAGLYTANLFAAGPSPQPDKAGKAENIRAVTDAGWNQHELQTLAAVQNHLFPRGDGSSGNNGPGADDINALAYLQSALDDPSLAEDKQFIRNGVGWLDDLSETTYEKTFLQLNDENREALLHSIAKSSAGENWLSTLLLYIFEALLTDPVYGGNPDGIGWAWLEHTPGFPRPPVDKTCRKLASR